MPKTTSYCLYAHKLLLLSFFFVFCCRGMAATHYESVSIEGLTPQVQTMPGDTTPVYKIYKSTDLAVSLGALAWDAYGFSQISKKDGSTPEKVNLLDKNNIGWFDRWAVYPYSKHIDKLSYVPFYIAIPLPLAVFALDGKMRNDFLRLSFLYLEAMSATGVFYTSAVHYVYRYRPLVYSQESPMDVRIASNARNSFFAGHVALVATSTFFIAQVLADYHPESHYKWAFYTGAGVATALTAYWRNHAGEHFPTDIAVGTLIGTVTGLLTPVLHRNGRKGKGQISLQPFDGMGKGMAICYNFK